MTAPFGAPLPDPNDPAAMAAFMSQMQHLFTVDASHGAKGPVNWEIARQVAAGELSTSNKRDGDAPAAIEPAAADSGGKTAVDDALRLADLWLEPATELPSGLSTTAAWSPEEWLELTQPTWQRFFEPVATRVVAAMSSVLPTELERGMADDVSPELFEQLAKPLGGLTGAVKQIGGVVFGAQVGHALGALATEVLSGTDIGMPLGPTGTAALLPANLAVFGAELERPADEVRLYVALREVAHHRLYAHVPWLRPHVLAAVEAYAAGIHVDPEAFSEALDRMRDSIDPEDPSSMQMVLSDNMFRPAATAEQQAALARLEIALALIEGWVTHVVDGVAGGRLAGTDALSETFRRRRAAGGPAEQTFANLVGLELRPRRLREAAALWAAVEAKRGISGRDAVWQHPDLLPTAEDLDDPAAFAEREPGVEIPGFDELEGQG